MKLFIDPDLAAQPATRHDRPTALINRWGATPTTFGYYSADPTTGPRCTRCNDLDHDHTWKLVNDGGVLACGRRS